MTAEYHRLGDYIREVNVRNRELKVTRLLGVGLEKKFFPSIANIIGTDLSNYKLIQKGQFGCKFMSVGRDGILPVSLLEEDEPAIISSAYYVFEVNDPNELLPDYLMMWLRRPEFDRQLWFYSGGDVRGGVNYDAFCEMPIYVPSIERQREIVSEYETLTRRILLNEQMIEKLEATAQALYRHTFVDNIDKQNLPQGWRMGCMGDLCTISSSKRIFESEYCNNGIPFYRGKEISQKKRGEQVTDLIYISEKRYNEIIRKYGKPACGDILLTAVGTIGNSYLVQEEDFYFKDGNIVWFHDFVSTGVNFYIYEYMQNILFDKIVEEAAIGSTQKALTIQSLLSLEIVIPSIGLLRKFGEKNSILYKNNQNKKQENLILTELQSLLLSKMGK